jgi:histidinol-phosphate/aromatic aminotransferase/cobyric acid decarboxylase-like protein/GNAT superfamily N-acetyltransferase
VLLRSLPEKNSPFCLHCAQPRPADVFEELDASPSFIDSPDFVAGHNVGTMTATCASIEQRPKRFSRLLKLEPPSTRVRIELANESDRQTIYRLRHEVYARELGQHPVNGTGRLQDPLDACNVYLVARVGNEMAGFISVTPPGRGQYSIEKYLPLERFPFPADERLYEVRLFTVLRSFRGSAVAPLLMYAALRWVESRGGTRIIGMGRREVLGLYRKAGFETDGPTIISGVARFRAMHAPVTRLRQRAEQAPDLLARLERAADWGLDVSFHRPAPCFHGGSFFSAIGERFEDLGRRHTIINADVLDAWFPPSPKVWVALERHLPWLLRTSPPTGGEGLIATLARTRGLRTECILPGAGSSALIFLAFRHWLNRASRALILDPTYGEYAHVLERVVRCHVDRLRLRREEGYQLDLSRLEGVFNRDYDLIVLVNPNSPTGRHIPRTNLAAVLRRVPASTRVWVDETYVDYVGEKATLETFAAASANVVVCKSMSKVYALSGARVAYLAAPTHLLEELRSLTPPWAVSLLAQVAAVRALQDPGYYAARYEETHRLRAQLIGLLDPFQLEIVPGSANFLLGHLPASGPDAATIVERCRGRGLFLRDASGMGTGLGRHALRIAVKDGATNERMARILAEVLGSC